MRRFSEVADAVAALNGKLDKVAAIAGYLRTIDDADLAAATRFFTGNPFAARDQRSLGLGGRTIVTVAKRVWGVHDAEISAAYRRTGDLGAAIGPLVRQPTNPQLFAPPALTPASLAAEFAAIADAAGKNAGKRREAVLESIFRACATPLEATYVVKIVTGDLRIGLREGLVHDAIASAFESTHREVTRAVMACGDAGEVAVAAKHGTLAEIHVSYGTPIGLMLASPIPYGDDYAMLDGASWVSEEKYDGIRAQAHVRDGVVRLFSRALNDISSSYPEIVRALASQTRPLILDGEIVAEREGRVLPFRTLQARLQRKEIDADLLRDVPLTYVVFDALAVDDDFLIDEPLLVRRDRLVDAFVPAAHLTIAPFEHVDAIAAGEINDRFERARARGHEGLMLKRTDAPYHPGRRGKWWLKLKRELTTLDVVVVAVEWGNGKRANVLSDYTFAVSDGEDGLLTIGKAYSGLTDAEIADLTQWFLAHRIGESGHRFLVEPQVVLEVAFDVVQRSDLHESGYALRFPRIVRVRDDKPASEIDTIERVHDVYAAMLEREGIISP